MKSKDADVDAKKLVEVRRIGRLEVDVESGFGRLK